MAHHVIRTRNGHQYEYIEESYRVPGEKNPRKRILEYLGRVDGGDIDPVTGKKKRKGLLGKIHEAVRSRQPWDETEKDIADRLAVFSAEKNIQARINNTLSKSMNLDQMKKVVGLQHSLKGTSQQILEAEKGLFHDPLETPVSADRHDGAADRHNTTTSPEPSAPEPSPVEPSPPSEPTPSADQQ